MNIEERIQRLERLEKLRYNLKGLLQYGWDKSIAVKDLGFKYISTFKELREEIEDKITDIKYNLRIISFFFIF